LGWFCSDTLITRMKPVCGLAIDCNLVFPDKLFRRDGKQERRLTASQMPRETGKHARLLIYLILFGLALYAALTGSSQGVAVPKRPARIQPKVQIDLPLPKVNFEDVADRAGLKTKHSSGGDKEKNYILETTGSGVALIDYDNDGLLDIFLVNG